MDWKQINDCPNYKISNTGQVVNIKTGKTIKGSIDKLGYPYVYLRDINGKPKIKKIHRLLGELFIPNPENKPEIDHINTDKSDFRLENLRWVTREENCNNPTTLEHKRGNKYKPYKPQIERLIKGCFKDESNFTKLYRYLEKTHSELELKKLLLFYLVKDFTEEGTENFYYDLIEQKLIEKVA